MIETSVLGVDVGGTNLRLGLVQGGCITVERRMHADLSGLCHTLPAEQAATAVQAAITAAIHDLLREFPQVAAAGIGFPGFIEPKSGMIRQSPNLPGLLDFDLAGPLSAQLGLPVVVENDALAAAYGEYVLAGLSGAGLIYFGLGTGVGGGLILDGHPYGGEGGVAMEVGHLIIEPDGRACGCGNRGCLEQYASASGVSATYAAATGQELAADEIARRCATGDADALAAYVLAGECLAQALAHVLKIVDVRHVVIGGGMSAAWPWLVPAFRRRLEQDLIPALRGQVILLASVSGDQAGMLGAAALAVRHLQQAKAGAS